MENWCNIVIPCRASDGRCSAAAERLLSQSDTPFLNVVLVINGSEAEAVHIDDSLHQAFTERGWTLTTLRRSVLGKVSALNAGDMQLVDGSIVYLDDDVVLSSNAVRHIHRSLSARQSPAIALVPPRRHDMKSFICRSYFQFLAQTPYCKLWLPGNGMYAVNPAGRSRWMEFPPICSDDTFVRLRFDESELIRLDSCYALTSAPDNPLTLMRVRARWCRGSRVARARSKRQRGIRRNRCSGILGSCIRHPLMLRHAPGFVLVVAGSWIWRLIDRQAGSVSAWQPHHQQSQA
ncbi:MAG: glycosyltransferase [Phycisphaeraceae bacterium]|nr:glycosyltransferase [Phycisphaerales bacterium]MCB9859891.1 glycosyltransferase [Phycisphaeraceae bacterium]